MFLRGDRLDMRALAAELRVSRATLYRWCGHREQLLSHVRMTEGFIYHDAVVGTEPDVERAASIVALLLE